MTPPGVPLFCVTCGTGQTFAGDVPVVCPACRQVTTWTTLLPYAITHMDARFLRSIHITSTETKETTP